MRKLNNIRVDRFDDEFIAELEDEFVSFEKLRHHRDRISHPPKRPNNKMSEDRFAAQFHRSRWG